MNCRQGDLAVIVRAAVAENLGKIVRCLRLATESERRPYDPSLTWWFTDTPIRSMQGRNDTLAPDESLRPLRDTDGTDEILSLIGKPVGDEVAA